MRVNYVDLARQQRGLMPELLIRIEKVLDSGNYILGEEVKEFEKRLAEYCNVKYAMGVNSCTDALTLSLIVLSKFGDEVIVPANSFVATANAVVNAGCKVVFADVRDDLNMNPEEVEKIITKKTKVIIPVHLTGRPAEMDSILEIAETHDCKVIEDAAQAIGAEYKGKRVGSLGDVGCFSFHPLKNLSCCGDGGAITTNDKEIYERLLKVRNHGLKNRDELEFIGVNSRLDELQAAILNVKMERIDIWKELRRIRATRYLDGLKGLNDVIRLPRDNEFTKSVYHTFVIQIRRRDELMQHLKEKDIESKIHYPIPIHLQKPYNGFGLKRKLPMTERLTETMLSLPMYAELSVEEQNYVIENIEDGW